MVCYCRMASKHKNRRDGLSDPVLFDNLDYSRLSDAPDAAVVNTDTILIIRGPKFCHIDGHTKRIVLVL